LADYIDEIFVAAINAVMAAILDRFALLRN
jgi:hypothetical protein